MYQIKSNSKGQITIPKAIREKYGLTAKITRIIYDCDVKKQSSRTILLSVATRLCPMEQYPALIVPRSQNR